MLYKNLCNYYERLESTTKNLEKRDIVCELLKSAKKEEIEELALASMGRVFPISVDKDLGIAGKMMEKIIASSFGASEQEVTKKYKELGDLGETAEYFSNNKKQETLIQQKLTVKKVYKNLKELPEITGKGSQKKKMDLIKELLVSSKPKEARYIVRTTLGEMRVGVGEGTVRDAIAKAFEVDKEKVESAFNLLTNYGKVAKLAKEKGEKGLEVVEMQIGKPIKVMLAENSSTLEEALEDAENPAIEYKYDGMRVELHKKDDKVKVFTRRLEDVTKQFPDIVKFSKEAIKVKKCIIEGEVVGLTPDKKELIPFQKLSRRIHRKYEIEEMIKAIPVRVELFDIIYKDEKNLMNKTQKERRKILEKTVKETNEVKIAKQLITDNLEKAQKFYKEALDAGHEGLMVKNLNAKYKPGKRVGYWYKVKPILETLDLVIIGAEWGTGKRGKWLSSYSLGIKDPETGNFLEVGKLGSGLTEEQLGEMTERLKPLIIESSGREVKIKPKIVIEVKYNEIQKSPNYSSGYALRFPRLERFREDKGPEDVDTTERLKKLYEKQ